jgi:hypothetical protein
MRTLLSAAALLVAAALAPMPAAAEQAACDPNPLTQGHPGWMKMPTGAVDLQAPSPVSASNPLMLDLARALPAPVTAASADVVKVNPLTNRP